MNDKILFEKLKTLSIEDKKKVYVSKEHQKMRSNQKFKDIIKDVKVEKIMFKETKRTFPSHIKQNVFGTNFHKIIETFAKCKTKKDIYDTWSLIDEKEISPELVNFTLDYIFWKDEQPVRDNFEKRICYGSISGKIDCILSRQIIDFKLSEEDSFKTAEDFSQLLMYAAICDCMGIVQGPYITLNVFNPLLCLESKITVPLKIVKEIRKEFIEKY